MEKMTQIELVKAAAARANLTQKDMKTALDAFLDEIKASVKCRKSVGLRGFGTFSLRSKPQREGRNPRTGETVMLPALDVIAFKAAR